MKRRYIWIEKDVLSDIGFDMAVEVYELHNDEFPKYVGGNYRLTHLSNYGYKGEACQILRDAHGHDTDNYNLLNKDLELKGLDG